MRLLFPGDPLASRKPDPSYTDELAAAVRAGFRYDVINFEALIGGDADHAVARVQGDSSAGTAMYRGWMMTPDAYGRLFDALQVRGVRLINTPEQYRAAHYLFDVYPFIKSRSAHTVFVPAEDSLDFERINHELGVFGNAPVVLKDYVKSRKHEWADACYIADASDSAEVERVTTNFVTRQGRELAGGLAYRAYADLRSIGTHHTSGMPLSLEYRAFVLHGDLMLFTPYWEVGVPAQLPPWSDFEGIARSIPSNFFTLDIAITRAGDAIIIEAGDGQVSAIPDGVDPNLFYEKLASVALSL